MALFKSRPQAETSPAPARCASHTMGTPTGSTGSVIYGHAPCETCGTSYDTYWCAPRPVAPSTWGR